MQQEQEYILAVYESGSISKAAERLFISQPALSMSIKKTEEALGMELFDRSKRPMQLTEAGEIYISAVKKIRQTEAELAQELQDIDSMSTGRIRMGASHYFNAIALAKFLTYFHKKYPGIQLEIEEGSSAAMARMLTDHRIDVTFSCNENYWEDFVKYPLFCDNILLQVPFSDPINERFRDQAMDEIAIARDHRHLQPDCPEVSLADFRDLEFIILKQGNNLRDRALEMFRQEGIQPKVTLELAQISTARRLSTAGFAATFVADRMIAPRRIDNGVCYYKIRSSLTRRLFFALLPQQNYIPKAVRVFIRELQEFFSEEGPAE